MSCVLFLTATTWLTMYCNQSVNVSRRLLARYSGKNLLLRIVKSRKPVMLALGLNKFPIDFSLNSHRKLASKQYNPTIKGYRLLTKIKPKLRRL